MIPIPQLNPVLLVAWILRRMESRSGKHGAALLLSLVLVLLPSLIYGFLLPAGAPPLSGVRRRESVVVYAKKSLDAAKVREAEGGKGLSYYITYIYGCWKP